MSDDFQLGADFARALDARDPLARFREHFTARSDCLQKTPTRAGSTSTSIARR